jgi:hypothetical protein
MRNPVKNWRFAPIALVALLALAGCSSIVNTEQPRHDALVTLQAGTSLGQTFVSEFDGLSGVAVYLAPGGPGDGVLRLHLRSSPLETTDLSQAELPLEKIGPAGFYRFALSSQEFSSNQAGYFSIDLTGSGSVQVGNAPGDAYLNGALYQDGIPQDKQLSFYLDYAPNLVVWGLLGEGLGWLGWIGVCFFLFVLPGWGLGSWLLPGWKFLHWAEQAGLAAGVSLAIYPLLLLWTSLLGLRLGPLYGWIPPLVGLVILLWKSRSLFVARKARHAAIHPEAGSLRAVPIQSNPQHFAWADLALIAILILVFGARLWAIRNLAVPLWGDSYQHAMITQLIVDHGGLFQSWQPYVPYNSLTVQFGFPALAALLTWVTGVDAVKSTLLAGQLVNGLAVLALYPLASRLGEGGKWAGTGAVLIAGLLSPMPGFYVNWGRYAQLEGLAILPPALWFLWEALDSPGNLSAKSKLRVAQTWLTSAILWIIAGLTLAGMMLAYYRMPFYYAAFLLIWLIGRGLPHWRLDSRRWASGLIQMAGIGLLALFLFAPWLLQVQGSHLSELVSSGVTSGSKLDAVLADMQSWREVIFFAPVPLLFISGIGVVWALLKRKWVVAALPVWMLFLALYELGQVVHLPGANLMQSFAVLISLYLPLALLGGWLLGQIGEFLERERRQFSQAGLTLGMLALAIWGVNSQKAILQLGIYQIVTQTDVQAMDWMRQNIPENALILVEGYRIYGGSSAVGSDGGWWAPLLAGRANTMPPQYALLNEAPLESSYTKNVVQLVADLENTSPASPQGIRWLCQWGVTHAYIGQRQGRAGIGATQLYSAQEFANSPAFRLIYHQDRVSIFALDPQACEDSR